MTGAEIIAEERQRQIDQEWWSAEHDAQHTKRELVDAAECYLDWYMGDDQAVVTWPWDEEWWKPSPNPIRNLAKAGALIAAEIDRLQREKVS